MYPELVTFLLKKFPKSEFFQVIKKAKKLQELRLLKGGLNRSLDKTMAIFLTKVHHGYSETGIMGKPDDEPEDEEGNVKDKADADLLQDIRKRIGK